MNVDRQVEAIVAAVAAGIPLGEAEARVVASWWHGGKGSDLHAFASSGYVDKWGLVRELRVCTPDAEGSHAALVAYVDALPDVSLARSFGSRAEYDAILFGTEPE